MRVLLLRFVFHPLLIASMRLLSLLCVVQCYLFSFVTLFFRKLGLLIEIRFLDLHVIDMSLCYTKVGSWSLSFLPGREEGVIPS